MEGAGSGEASAEVRNDGGIDAGTDQNLRTVQFVTQLQHLSDGVRTGRTGGGTAAGQHGVDAQIHGIPVGFQRVPGHVDAAVQRQTAAFGGFQQRFHGVLVQFSVGSQAADDKSAGTGLLQFGDLLGHQLDLLGRIEKIAGTGTHETADSNVTFRTDLPEQSGIGRQTAGQKCGTQFQTVGTGCDGCPGRGQRVHTDFQNRHDKFPSCMIFIRYLHYRMSAVEKQEIPRRIELCGMRQNRYEKDLILFSLFCIVKRRNLCYSVGSWFFCD